MKVRQLETIYAFDIDEVRQINLPKSLLKNYRLQ